MSSPPQFEKKTSLKSEKKYKNDRQAEYHHALNGRKALLSAVHWTRTWDLSFMKRVCYQLNYPSEWKIQKKQWHYIFDLLLNKCWLVWHTLQHCSVHIITHCWTSQVGQFGHLRQHCMINCDVMLDQQCASIWPQPYLKLGLCNMYARI